MSKQFERSTATRTRILAVARAAFARDGYGATSLDRIAAEAGVTKGALYHHYDGKEALFAAVFEIVSLDTVAAAGARAAGVGAPRERLKAAAMAWLEAVERGDARAILLDIAPAALGFARARAIEERLTLEPLARLARAVIEAEGLGEAVDAVFAARLVNAGLAEIALLRHAANGDAPDMAMAARAMAGIIDGVLKGPG